MKARRQRGATLGLVAACVFLVIIVGVGFFFLSKIIGGGREVANATDAGALNVAKHAVRRGAVALAKYGLTDEFGELTEPKNSNVDLVTYNRLVAQALIVGKNAEVEGTPLAKGNANFLAGQVKQVGLELKTNLEAAGTMDADFTDMASRNNTKMWNGSPVNLDGPITAGYMKKDSSTNVYFDPATLSALGWGTLPAPMQNSPLNQKSKSGQVYLAGYKDIVLLGNPNFIMGVPVLPQTKPHLVDHGQFTATAFDANTPPNSFRTNGRALEAKSGNIGGTVACAIVGTIDKDFQAVIPRGYLRVMNGNDATVNNGAPTGVPVSNGNQDIFNNELFNSPGIMQANNAGNPVFTHTGDIPTARAKWKAYIATMGSYPKGSLGSDGVTVNNTTDEASPNYGAGDPVLFAGISGMISNSAFDLRTTGAVNHFADYNDLINLGNSSGDQACIYSMYDDAGTLPAPCITGLDDWTLNFGRNLGGVAGGGATQPGGFTNVEFMKADLLGKIAGRKGGKFCATVAAAGKSGLKAWPESSGTVLKPGVPGSAVPYIGGASKVNYLSVDTTYKYLTQMNGGLNPCNANPIIDEMVKRMQQVEPKVTKAEVIAALDDKTCPLTLANGAGTGKLYLYVDASTKKPKMSASLPWKDTNLSADGPSAAGPDKCDSKYPLNGWAVNTYKGYSGSTGDGNYHENPFTKPNPGSGPSGTDSALWQASSGYNNLLGELKFEQVTEGATFCKPN